MISAPRADKNVNAIEIEFGGETLTLLADKAVVWAREKTLFLADVHLGKAASFRAAGLAVPSGHSRADIARIAALIERHRIERLVVLGDLVHNRASYTPQLDAAISEFAANHRALERLLVLGNHDLHAGTPPVSWGFTCIAEDLALAGLVAAHEPLAASDAAAVGGGARLCGHIHPSILLRTAKESINLPCFWQSSVQLVIPSFGSLTGRYTVSPAVGDVTYVVTRQQIFRISKATL